MFEDGSASPPDLCR